MRVHIYEEKSKRTGKTSLIMHTVGNGVRIKKALGLYFKTIPQTEDEKRDKKEKLLIAAKIANDEEKRVLCGEYLITDQYRTTDNFIVYAENFIAQHAVKDKRKYYGVVSRLKSFFGKDFIPCFELSEVTLKRFAKSLENELNGESAHNYWSKLKQIINAATEELYFKKNPAGGIRIKKSIYQEKDILTHQELQKLFVTPLGNEQVKAAFLLACLTGLRWVDIKELCWKHIKDNFIFIVQSKTKVGVTIPLTDDAKRIIGDRKNLDDRVFNLPSHTGTLKWLRKWAEIACVDKHVTFHVGRHSYGTALISNGVDVSIASKLLGHQSLKCTTRYLRITENLKLDAIKKLPSLAN